MPGKKTRKFCSILKCDTRLKKGPGLTEVFESEITCCKIEVQPVFNNQGCIIYRKQVDECKLVVLVEYLAECFSKQKLGS